MTFAENEQILGQRTELKGGDLNYERRGTVQISSIPYQSFSLSLSLSPSFISRPMSRMIWAPFCGRATTKVRGAGERFRKFIYVWNASICPV